MYATSLIMLLATPVLAAVLALIAVERLAGIGIFDPALGGDPVLFQHLFWFYSHPAVYIMILPGMGVVSELVTCFSRKNIFGYKFVAWASVGIAVVGFLVWGHHMFVAGQSLYAAMVFSAAELLWWRSRRPSRCSTGRRRCTAGRSRSRRRCCTRWGSSCCSPSAA